MKITHYKQVLTDPNWAQPRLYCDTRLVQKHRSQTLEKNDVTCNRCRFLLQMPEVLHSKPYRKSRAKDRRTRALEKEIHFDCGAYLFCDQRHYVKGFPVGGAESVTCAACLYVLKTGKKNVSEFRIKGYHSARSEMIYTPENQPLMDEDTRKDSHAP